MGFCLITSRRFAASVRYIHFFITICSNRRLRIFLDPYSSTSLLKNTHTHRKGLFYEVNVNKSRFFFRSLHCFFSFSFLCFSHIETTPHQISYPSQVSPPQRTNHSQITSHCELIDPGFPGIIAQFKSGRFLRCGRGVFFFFYVREGGSVRKKNEVE